MRLICHEGLYGVVLVDVVSLRVRRAKDRSITLASTVTGRWLDAATHLTWRAASELLTMKGIGARWLH